MNGMWLERLISVSFLRFGEIFCITIYCVYVLSLHTESTDSVIHTESIDSVIVCPRYSGSYVKTKWILVRQEVGQWVRVY